MSKPILTQDYLNSIFYYNGNVLRWKVKKAFRINIGDVAGSLNKDGYVKVEIDGHKINAHRIIWMMVYGFWPQEIDHINRKTWDNKLSNLRESDRELNTRNRNPLKNSKIGFNGVFYNNALSKWNAQIGVGKGKRIHLGSFDTLQEAMSMRLTAEDSLWNL